MMKNTWVSNEVTNVNSVYKVQANGHKSNRDKVKATKNSQMSSTARNQVIFQNLEGMLFNT